MGILLSKDLKDSDWGTYHAIDTNRDGRTDVLVLNFPDVDGDGWMDIGSRAWVYDRNYDGRVDAAEHVSATGEVIPLESIGGKYDLRLSF